MGDGLEMGLGRWVPEARMLIPTHPVPQVTLWLWVNSVVMTQKVSVPQARAKGVDGDPGTETLTILVTPCFPPLVHNFLFSLQTLLLACQKGTSPTVM